MHFDCPGCRQRLEIENDRVGEHLPCPVCNRTIRVPMPPLVIHKGRRTGLVKPGSGMASGGHVRLVPIPAADRHLRKGSLAERVAALKAAAQPPAEDPKLL